MEETLEDIVSILLADYINPSEDEDASDEYVDSFMSFYRVTYHKKHSLQSRIYLTTCSAYVFSDIWQYKELDRTDQGRLLQAYVNSVMEVVDAWRADEETLFDAATKNALLLLRIWLERVHPNSSDDRKTSIKTMTALACMMVGNPMCTLLYYACQQQTFLLPGIYEEVLTPSRNVAEYILSNNFQIELPQDSDESLPNLLVSDAYGNRDTWTESQMRDAAECAALLHQSGFEVYWEPIQHMREFARQQLHV